MTARQIMLPRLWLMTDERISNRLWEAIDRLPEGEAGVVFRHYATEPGLRGALAERVAQRCRERGLTLAIARDVELARRVEAAFVHNPAYPNPTLPLSRAVHSLEEAVQARAEQPVLIFVSPIFDTRSHLGRPPLGTELGATIAAAASAPAIALGGMNAGRFAPLQHAFHGWAGIDAWLEG